MIRVKCFFSRLNARNLVLGIIVFLILLLVGITIKESHAFYNSTNTIQIVNAKVGDFGGEGLVKLCWNYDNLGECITNKKNNIIEIENLSNPVQNDNLARYQGTAENVDNNYICFGTTDKNECVKDTDKYMYRILGIVVNDDNITNEKAGQLKVIKKEALNSAKEWQTVSSGVEWNKSTLYADLNGIYFLSNTQYIPNTIIGNTTWKDLVMTINWRHGSINISNTGADQNGIGVLTAEKALPDTETAKIGLMYLSDYYLAYDNTSNWYIKRGTDNWLFIGNSGASDPGNKYEWTMLKYTSQENNIAWRVYDNGGVGSSYMNVQNSVRPAFYVSKEMKITSGKGTKDDPYILGVKIPTIISAKITSDTGTKITVDVNATDDKGVTKYCYKLNTEDNYKCTTSKTNTFNVTAGVSYIIYIYVEDADGNSSNVYKLYRTAADLVIANAVGQIETDEARKTRPGDVLRRFQNTDPTKLTNNYICFGTSDSATCKNNPEIYMYRILGVVAENGDMGEKVGQLKIIKQTPLSSTYKWNDTHYNGSIWKDATLYKQLNGIPTGYGGTYDLYDYPSNIFLTNETYVPDTPKIGSKTWKDIIVDIKWRYGNLSTYSDYKSGGTVVLAKEMTWTDKTEPSKIGLLYLSDYYLASDNTTSWFNASSDRKNWLYNTSTTIWTMTAYDSSSVWYIGTTGYDAVSFPDVDTYSHVKPVFFLSEKITIDSTTIGTIDNPFIITDAG